MDSDGELRGLVLDELTWDALVDESQIDAAVERGIVTLVGTVPSYAMKLGAQEAVRSVEGVHDVVDEIDVGPRGERSVVDEELVGILTQVLVWDSLVPDQDLSVSVSDGWVTLRGSVTAASQRTEAERSVAHIAGVRGVTNEIEIVDLNRVPRDVRAEIAGALGRRATHRLGHIDVIVDGAHVSLRGVVQTEAEKTAVLGAVAHAPGVVRVVCDELRVDPGS